MACSVDIKQMLLKMFNICINSYYCIDIYQYLLKDFTPAQSIFCDFKDSYYIPLIVHKEAYAILDILK